MKKNVFFMRMPVVLLALGLVVSASLALAGCDSAGSSGVEDGDLEGSSWQRQYGSSSFEYTDTYTFTSDSSGNYNHKGWGMIGSKKNNYNTTTNFTYVYDGEVNMLGVMTMSSGSQRTFSVSSDYKTLTVSNTQYTRK
jgi:hypothetical protein